MSRHQRQRAHDRAALHAALDKFVAQPCALTPEQVHALLNELCSKLGYCLAPREYAAIEANPPTNPQDFAELVVKLDGVDPKDQEMLAPVLRCVLAAFEGAAKHTRET